ncbi:ABC transporter permease [Streptomonospora nanhaiensis]|uniref:ABC transporter permease n=1 Tax=Streptomonospora nanhaiensis TaxID=1323731 RepID=UPI001C99C8FB|nr:ABC transporter permease [Streptomonospora nanhaiensis]MBX9387498.1 ABC transporter permease [Streptomonospora nanhaiensis]
MSSPTVLALRSGLRRGWIEFRQSMTSREDLIGYLGVAVVFTVMAMFMRGESVRGTDVPIANMWLAGIVGFLVASSGITSVAQGLAVDREDGTLLRAKAVPHGMTAYLLGKAVYIIGVTAASVTLLLVPAFLLFDGFGVYQAADWITLAWVPVLGLLSMAPIGAVLGSLITNPRATMGLIMLPFMALMGISGVFYQVSGFPEWLQWIAQVFPLYWIALGMRSVFLPDSMLAIEIGEPWRLGEAALVMALWAAVGFVVAAAVLRRMARRESGSRMEAGRRRAMQRA